MIKVLNKSLSYTTSLKFVAAGVLGVGFLLALATYSRSFSYTVEPDKIASRKQPKFAPLNPLIFETAFDQGAIAVITLRSDADREVKIALRACDMSIDLAMVCLPELIATSVRKDLPNTTTELAAKVASRALVQYERDFKEDEARAIPDELASRILSRVQENLRKCVELPAKQIDLLLSVSDIFKLAMSSVPLTSDETAFVSFVHHMVTEQRLVVTHIQETDLMSSPDLKVAVAAIRSELTSAELPRRARAMGMLEARPSLGVWLSRDLIRIAHANDDSSDSAWFAFMTSILYYREWGGEEVVGAMLKTLPTFDKELYDELGTIAVSNMSASEFQKQICAVLKAKHFGVPAIRFCEMLAASSE